ncbi:MAG: immunoglobulin domain-containing protein [Phycisphaerales bacterium]
MLKNLLRRVFRPVAAILAAIAGVGLSSAAALGQGETGPVARFTTSAGPITFVLFDSKPIATTNFINIITAGNYTNVILNRNPQDFVIQGGGFFAPAVNNGAPTATPAVSPITGEPGVSNLTGTLSMALSTGPNSGTKEFFFNLDDNTFLDGAASGGPFTAFGRIRGQADVGSLETINNLTKFNICSQLVPAQNCAGNPQNLPFGSVPLIGYAGLGNPVAPTNYVIIQVAEVSPQIRTQPTAQAVFQGQNAMFTVGAAGTGTLAYQWRRNGMNLANGGAISGATGPTLTITGAQAANAGSYDCLVSNNITTELAIAAAASAAVALTVDAPPTINTHPSNTTVTMGNNAQFTVAASGAGTLTFQWRRGLTNLTNGATGNGSTIAGATTATLMVNSAQLADAGNNYNCLVSNTAGGTASNNATLTVNVAPTFTQQPSNSSVSQGQTAMFTAAASGTPAPTLQWRRNGNNLSDGGNISGATTGTLTIANAGPGNAGSYDCVATNVVSAVPSNAVALEIRTAPVISGQPGNVTAAAGGMAQFNVMASGVPNPTFQWRKGTTNINNGARVSGATTANLTITGLLATDAGNYNCVVSNSEGSVPSNDGVLTVNFPPTITMQPANTTVVTGSMATFTVAATATPAATFQWRRGTTNLVDGGKISGATTATLTITNAQAGDAASNYNCVATNAQGSATSNNATLTVTTVPVITQQPTSNGVAIGGNTTLRVVAVGTAPLSYQWRRNGVNLANGPTGNGSTISGATSANMTISAIANADVTSYNCVVSNAANPAGVASSAVVLQIVAPPTITTQPMDQAAPVGGQAVFSAVATGQLTSFQWRRNGIMLSDSAKYSGAHSAMLTINNLIPADFGSFDVVVSNGAGQIASIVANLTVIEAPTFSGHPQSITLDPGQTVNFVVIANPAETLTYQWKRNGMNLSNGGRFSGVTSASLVITGLVGADAGDYTCMVSNIVGNATSNAATLIVNAPPVITDQPDDVTKNQGQSASFTVVATGQGTFTYQWFRGVPEGSNGNPGGAIPGATMATYTIPAVVAGDAGPYHVTVTNGAGTTISNTATLSVNTSPVIVTPPSPQSKAVGGTANFSVVASGTGPLTYRWRRNGINLNNNAQISGALTANLQIINLTAANAGNYSCVVTGAVSPAATSASASLTVVSPPLITTDPVSQTVDPQVTVTFSVVASGSQLMYQWRKDTVNLMNGPGISGVNGPGLTLSGVFPGVSDGLYDVVVSNTGGMATSAAATLVVRDLPIIDTQPFGGTFGAGSITVFSVGASGTGPITYQWFKGTPPMGVALMDGGNISGSQSTTLEIDPLVAGDAGTYYCVVSNGNGSVTTQTASLIVLDPPNITVEPTDANVVRGSGNSAVFTLTAVGSPTLLYEWMRDGTPLMNGGRVSGADTATLTIAMAEEADQDLYSCQVTNQVGSDTSVVVSLNIGDVPVVNTVNYEPNASFNLVAPNGTMLSLTDVEGTEPLTYQWRRDGNNLFDVMGRNGSGTIYAGTQTPTLTISNTHADGTGTYDCVVTNAFGQTTSPFAAITVVFPPAITTQPTDQFVPTGDTATFMVAASGTEPLAYQWFNDGDPITNGGRFSGADTPTLMISMVESADVSIYSCLVTNDFGQATSNAAGLLVGDPPVITVNPAATVDLAVGGSTSLSVAATGTAPLTFQWFRGSMPLAEDCPSMGGPPRFCGTQTATLTISVAQMGDSGLYHCVVTNDYGQATSTDTDLAVVFPPQIAVQPELFNFGYQGGSVSVAVQAVGGRLSYQWQNSNNNVDYVDLVDGPASTIVPTSNATVSGANTPTLTFTGLDFAFFFAQFNRCVVTNAAGQVVSSFGIALITGAPQITVHPSNSAAVNGSVAQFTAEFTTSGPGPLTYQWFHNDVALTPDGHILGSSGTANQTGPNTYSATLAIFGVQDADVGDYYCRVTDPSPNSTNTAQASLRQGRPIVITQNHVNGGLYTTGGFATSHIWTGSGPFTVTWRKDGVPIVPDGRITILDTFILGDGRIGTQLNLNPSIPGDTGFYDVVVCNPPAGMDNCVTSVGGTITFGDAPVNDGIGGDTSVALGGVLDIRQFLDAGTGPFTYEWFKGTSSDPALVNGGRISGADTQNLEITGITADDAGQYTCRVSSPFGSFDNSVTVTVGTPPSITDATTGPVNVDNGDTFQLGLEASGDPTLLYQWRREGVALMDGADISGSQSSFLSVSNASFASGGNYTCEVTNDFGSDMTAQIVVNVLGTPPTFTLQPQATLIRPVGANAAFSVAATGDPTPSYQWFITDGVDSTPLTNGLTASGSTIAGADTAMLQISNVQSDDYSVYFCVATNAVGSVQSQDASLEKLVVPAFTEHPADQTATEGDTVTFTARIDPALQTDNSFLFTWFVNGSNVVSNEPARFAASVDPMDPYRLILTITGVALTDAGTVVVRVDNGSGNNTSNEATLTVNANVPPCPLDYTPDGVVNPDDLGDFITDYFTAPPIPGPDGYAIACPENEEPYDLGYKAAYTVDLSGQCNEPNPDNLGDFITDYFAFTGDELTCPEPD